MSWYSIVRRGGTTSTPWDPSQLSSTSIWVDIDSLGLSNGSGITTLTDRSGNGYDLADPDGGTDHATVVSGDLNGLDVAQFNDLGGYTLYNWPGPYNNDGVVFAAVIDLQTPATNAVIADLRVGNQQLFVTLLFSNGNFWCINNRRAVADADVDLNGPFVGGTGWSVVVMMHDYVTGDITVQINGTSVLTGTLTSTGAGPETNLSVALGSNTTMSAPFEHKMAEALWCDNRLTTGATGDLERVEGYLAHRYALQSKLPAGHPYKTTAPTA